MSGYKPMQPSEIASIVEELVRLPRLYLAATLHDGRLLVYGYARGETKTSLYALDPSTGRLERLVRPDVYSFGARRYEARRLIVARDVSRGREQVRLYVVDLASEGREEQPIEGVGPARLLGLADDGETAGFVMADERGIAVYAYRRGEAWRVASLPGVGWVTDVKGDIIVGSGMLKGSPETMEIFVANAATGDLKIYTPREGASCVEPVVTSKGILLQSNHEGGVYRLYLLDPENLQLEPYRPPSPDLDRFQAVEYPGYHEAPDGRVVVIGKREARTRIFVDGREVPGPQGVYYGARLLGDRVLANYTSLRKPTRIIELDGRGGYREVYTPGEPRWLEERLGETRHVYVESVGGVRVPVLVLESKAAPKPGPTVVLVHGGPFADYDDSFNIFAASLASMGLHVVMPNYRGSTGYGEDYRRMVIGDPCGGELEDIANAALWARREGLASHLLIMGYSYGGYMTLCGMFRKPDIFECGVAGASVVDWEEMYELSDAAFKKFIEIVTAGRRELWRERSPITYADNLKGMLCIVHPQNDTRTPLKPLLRLLGKLLEAGKSFEAHIAPDMGHIINSVEDAEKILLPALLFINRCLPKLEEQAESGQ